MLLQVPPVRYQFKTLIGILLPSKGAELPELTSFLFLLAFQVLFKLRGICKWGSLLLSVLLALLPLSLLSLQASSVLSVTGGA